MNDIFSLIQSGPAVRVFQHGGAVEAAVHFYLWEQQIRHGDVRGEGVRQHRLLQEGRLHPRHQGETCVVVCWWSVWRWWLRFWAEAAGRLCRALQLACKNRDYNRKRRSLSWQLQVWASIQLFGAHVWYCKQAGLILRSAVGSRGRIIDLFSSGVKASICLGLIGGRDGCAVCPRGYKVCCRTLQVWKSK